MDAWLEMEYEDRFFCDDPEDFEEEEEDLDPDDTDDWLDDEEGW